MPVIQKEITLPEYKRGYHIITEKILDASGSLPDNGICHVFIKHTSAGLCISENADPSVRRDFETIFNSLVPEDDPSYTHTDEGPDDMPSHIKAVMTGSSVTIPISNGKFNLGTWQGIYLCEFRNDGGRRKLVVTIIN
jgi:secondary thiamine-phosphate synthase enzyme